MKHIIKGTEPQKFTEWKNRPSRRQKKYKNLKGKVKKAVYASLIAEQGGICAYCERPLMESGRITDYHIDHLNPQSLHTGDDLDYNNFVCSCIKELAKGDPIHCGHEKKTQILAVHPFLPMCESKFKYTHIGEILPTDQDSQDTINVLKLDIRRLNDLRHKTIEPFNEIDDINDLKTFVAQYLQKDSNGFFSSFHTTIRYLFGSLLETQQWQPQNK